MNIKTFGPKDAIQNLSPIFIKLDLLYLFQGFISNAKLNFWEFPVTYVNTDITVIKNCPLLFKE